MQPGGMRLLLQGLGLLLCCAVALGLLLLLLGLRLSCGFLWWLMMIVQLGTGWAASSRGNGLVDRAGLRCSCCNLVAVGFGFVCRCCRGRWVGHVSAMD